MEELKERLTRPALLWERSSAPYSSDELPSLFGGVSIASVDESWPEDSEGPFCPLLQLNLESIPYRPPGLEGVTVITLFFSTADRWCLRTYTHTSELVPISHPNQPDREQSSVLAYPQLVDDYPCSLDLDCQLESDLCEAFSRRYAPLQGIKLGGWPVGPIKGRPILQLDQLSFHDPSWSNGTQVYFYRAPKSSKKEWSYQFAAPQHSLW